VGTNWSNWCDVPSRYNLKYSDTGWSWGETCGLKWTSGVGWTEHLANLDRLDTTTTPGVVRIDENGGWIGGFVDPFYVAPPVLPAFGGPNLVSAIPDVVVLTGGSKSVNVASHFNATKSPGSAFKYFVTTNNHALLIIQNASQDFGTFELKSLNTSGNATVTVKVMAVERDVDVWVATSTFAVSVGNNAPTLEVALPDVSGTQNFSLSEYFKDDHGQFTYSLTVEDPNVVNATLVGSTLYVQNGLFRDGSSLVTITASDGFASVNDTLNATYSFAVVSFQFTPTPKPLIAWPLEDSYAPVIDDTKVDYNTNSLSNAYITNKESLQSRYTIAAYAGSAQGYFARGRSILT
jgi:hypothetical protein